MIAILIGAVCLGFVLIVCLKTPDWADEDFDHETEARLRGWDKPS